MTENVISADDFLNIRQYQDNIKLLLRNKNFDINLNSFEEFIRRELKCDIHYVLV